MPTKRESVPPGAPKLASSNAGQKCANTGEEAQEANSREDLHNAILERVVQSIDIDGLSDSVVDAVATHFAEQVRVEDLIQSLLQQESHELTDKLAVIVLGRIGKTGRSSR